MEVAIRAIEPNNSRRIAPLRPCPPGPFFDGQRCNILRRKDAATAKITIIIVAMQVRQVNTSNAVLLSDISVPWSAEKRRGRNQLTTAMQTTPGFRSSSDRNR